MGFLRQEYWSGLPFPSPGDVPNPGTKPGFPALQAIIVFSHITKAMWEDLAPSLRLSGTFQSSVTVKHNELRKKK